MNRKYFLLVGVALSTLLACQNARADAVFDEGYNKTATKTSTTSADAIDYVNNVIEHEITDEIAFYLNVTNPTSPDDNGVGELTVKSGGGLKIAGSNAYYTSSEMTASSITIENGGAYHLPTKIIIGTWVDENPVYGTVKVWDSEMNDGEGGYREGTIYDKTASNMLVTEGSTLAVYKEDTADNVEVRENGMLWGNAKKIFINDLTLRSGGAMALDSAASKNFTKITGDFVLYAGANIYNKTTGEIFVDAEPNKTLLSYLDKLTLVDGVNPYLINRGDITAETENAELIFADSAETEGKTTYDLTTWIDGKGDSTISGWSTMSVTKDAIVKSETVSNFTVKNGGELQILGDNSETPDVSSSVTVETGGKVNIAAGTLLDGLIIQGTAEEGGSFDITLDSNTLINGIKLYGAETGIDINNDVENFTVGKGSTLRITDEGSITGSDIYGTVVLSDESIATGGNIYGTVVLNGGSSADGATLQSGGTLTAGEDATLSNLNVLSGSTLNAASATMTGSVTINKDATLVGDYTDIGTRESITDLTLVGGINTALGTNIQGNGNNDLWLDGGSYNASSTTFTDWKEVVVEGTATLSNYTVTNGVTLDVDNGSTVNNLTLESGATFEAESGAIISGTATVDAGASLAGTYYDYTKIGDDVDELILKNGMNTAFAGGLTSDSGEATLRLTNGEYSLDSNVSGWKNIEVEADTKQEGNISLAAGGTLHVADSKTWDFSGHSPFVGTISGNVLNNGTISALDSLHSAAAEAGDKLTITGNYTAGSGARLDLDVDAEAGTADVLAVEGKIEGTTNVNLTFITDGDSSGAIQVVENSSTESTGSFVVGSIYGSPFAWEIAKQADGWYIDHAREPEPGPGPEPGPEPRPAVILTPETGAYLGLLKVSFEQTKDMTRSVRNKIYETSSVNGLASGDNNNLTMWVSPAYSYAKAENPFEFRADVKGIDAGFDIASSNKKHRIGSFASYRRGDYEYSGKGRHYKLSGKADTDINSWLGGLYYNYDNEEILFNALVYAGRQSAKINGRNSVTADGHAYEGGMGAEFGYRKTLNENYTITPMVAVDYAMISYENLRDNAGKRAKYGTAQQTAIDFGIRLERAYASENGVQNVLYIKPSIVQTVNYGDKVAVTGLRDIKTLDDNTFFRLSAGGHYNMKEGWSVNAESAWTTNNSYDSLSINLGIKYEF